MGIRRHVNLGSYALGNVLKYGPRSAVLVLALMFSTALLCSTEFIHEGVTVDIYASASESPDIVVQRLEAGRQALVPQQWVKNASVVRGVRLVTPRVWGYVDIGGGRLVTVMGVNASVYGLAFGAVGTDVLDGGRFIQPDDRGKIVVGQGIVDLMQNAYSPVTIGVGSSLGIVAYNGTTMEFEVVGVFSSQARVFSNDLIVTDLQSARDLFGLLNASGFTDLAVWTEYHEDINDVAFRLDTRLAGSRVLTRDAIRDLQLKAYGGRAGAVALVWATSLASIVLVAFMASSAASDEARREVGLLKALGYDTVDVIEIRMFEATVISLFGASLGVSAAVFFDFVLGAPGLALFLLGWSIPLLNNGIPLAVSAQTIFTAYVVAITPVIVATVVPAWRNAITEPDTVLRGV